jgi:hypothetical protein
MKTRGQRKNSKKRKEYTNRKEKIKQWRIKFKKVFKISKYKHITGNVRSREMERVNSED